ncbi:hypothetical protein [Flavobacterium sp.]|uniref:hypothetical protein n=1 Tax=Flavobacterium sp. TaxID=239 RepID=UPI00286AC82C|nr:hypothetical protein [Flavobacterium sp.]
MKKLIILLIGIVIFIGCESNTYADIEEEKNDSFDINLKWNKAYPDDSIDKSVIGLKWALSYLGAKLPKNLIGISYSNAIISMNINQLGFNENAVEKLSLLNIKIKESQEYKNTNTIDLGRFVSLLLGSSEHYYQISGTPNRLEELLGNYILKPEKGYVNNSGVSLEHRIIKFSEQVGFNQVFLSQEVDPITQEIYEFETIELLPNGQLRFGIFDVNGRRKNNADSNHSNAGKPAKCMWCHESSINQLFSPQLNFSGYLTATQFQNTLINYRNLNKNLKLNLDSAIDYSQTQQHTLTELLYISFMEPSAERVSLEWNLPLNKVQSLLSGLSTHVYDEFPFLGNLYHRNEIEKRAPFPGLAVSSSVREMSNIEVNHLK